MLRIFINKRYCWNVYQKDKSKINPIVWSDILLFAGIRKKTPKTADTLGKRPIALNIKTFAFQVLLQLKVFTV